MRLILKTFFIFSRRCLTKPLNHVKYAGLNKTSTAKWLSIISGKATREPNAIDMYWLINKRQWVCKSMLQEAEGNYDISKPI